MNWTWLNPLAYFMNCFNLGSAAVLLVLIVYLSIRLEPYLFYMLIFCMAGSLHYSVKGVVTFAKLYKGEKEKR